MSVKAMSHDGPCRKTLYEYQHAQDRELYGKTRHGASCDMAPVAPLLIGAPTAAHAYSPRCLVPFNRREGLTTAEAAERANRTERTIRMWCRDYDIGRRVAGGPWLVSRVALAMFLNDDAQALRAYLAGDRHSPRIAAYFVAEGLGELFAG